MMDAKVNFISYLQFLFSSRSLRVTGVFRLEYLHRYRIRLGERSLPDVGLIRGHEQSLLLQKVKINRFRVIMKPGQTA